MRILCILAMIALLAPAVQAEVIVESGSGEEFPALITWNDPAGGEARDLQAMGTGLRKKAWFKVYAACFYVQTGTVLGEDPYAAAIEGDFAKSIAMRFLRDVGSDKIVNAYREGIRKTLPEGHDEAIDSFVGFFEKSVNKGEELTLRYWPGQGLSAFHDERPLGSIDDAEVIAAIWATWFGEEPISKDLKRGLVGL